MILSPRAGHTHLSDVKLLNKPTLSYFFLPILMLPAIKTQCSCKAFCRSHSLLHAEWQAAISHDNLRACVIAGTILLIHPYPFFMGRETPQMKTCTEKNILWFNGKFQVAFPLPNNDKTPNLKFQPQKRSERVWAWGMRGNQLSHETHSF